MGIFDHKNSNSSKRRIGLGEFVFDLETLELLENDEVVNLPVGPASLLKALIEKAPDLLSREDACAALWPNGCYGDPNAGLNAAVRQLREAFRERADNNGMIVTSPKRGYRLRIPSDAGHRSTSHPSDKIGEIQQNLGRLRTLTFSFSVLAALVAVAVVAMILPVKPNNFQTEFANADPTAVEHFLRGKALIESTREEDLVQALEHFERASLSDPRLADAFGFQALVLQRLAGRPNYPYRDTYIELLDRVQTANKIGASAAAKEAHAYFLVFAELDPKAASGMFEEAIKLNPNSASAYAGLALAEAASGNTASAYSAAKQARNLNPQNFIHRSDVCWYAALNRDHAEIQSVCRISLEIDGPTPVATLALALSSPTLQERQIAADQYLELIGISAKAKLSEEGVWACDPAEVAVEQGFSADRIAALFALCGDQERTQHWLTQALTVGVRVQLLLPVDPRYDLVRSHITDFY